MNKNNKIKLVLTLNVEYVPNGVSIAELREVLESAVDHLSNNGLITSDTAAEVETLESNVTVDLSSVIAAKSGTEEHTFFVSVLEELAESVDGVTRSDYSGRGMMGRKCYSVVAESEKDILWQANWFKLPRPEFDNMGLGVVAYWPGIEGK